MLIKIILLLLLFVALVFVGLLIHGTLTVFKPKEKTILEATGKGINTLPTELSFMIWNVGYGGLGKESDFFYDGGKTVYGPKSLIEKNVQLNTKFIETQQQMDFILLQEVDKSSKRSYKINQYEAYNKVLPQHTAAFATNYKVQFLPFPFNKPLGKILSGLASYSKYQSVENVRYQFPGSYGWPKSNYLLKRCFLLQRFPTQNGQQLVVINTHNSAYDSGGKLKIQEMDCLKNVLNAEYEKGNYIVVGGDWNQIPTGFNNNTFKKTEAVYEQIPIPDNYLSADWQWPYDDKTPTNRKLEKPYEANYTFTTVIDFYLISPNIELLEIRAENLDFESSDHQPVFMRVRLK